jgi:hypothetical protein
MSALNTRRALLDKRLIVFGVLVGLAIRLWIAWQPTDELSWRANADDAYYYFKLAQHLGSGAGATFDGVNPTNGFHPLYALLLVPIFQYVGNDIDRGVHLALTLVALVSSVTAWPIYLAGKYVHSPLADAIGALAHLLNPWVVVLTMTGVESAVYVCCFAWTVMAYVRWRSHEQSLHGIVLIGLLAGLTIMARSEGVLLLAGIVLDRLVVDRRVPGRAIVFATLCGLFAAIVCLPWVLWSISRFGTPLQISASAIMLHSYAGMPADAIAAVEWYIGRISWFLPRYAYKILLFNLPIVLLFGVVIGRSWSTRQLSLKIAWSPASQSSFLILPFICITAYYNVILLHQQHWYFNALVLIFTLIGASIGAEEMLRSEEVYLQQKYQRFATSIICAIFIIVIMLIWQRGLYPNQNGASMLGRQIAGADLRYERLGATDNGIVGFFCRCIMVNLDGVMNNAAVAYYRVHGYDKESILRFARAQHVAYVWGIAPFDSDEARIVRRIRFPAGIVYQIR